MLNHMIIFRAAMTRPGEMMRSHRFERYTFCSSVLSLQSEAPDRQQTEPQTNSKT